MTDPGSFFVGAIVIGLFAWDRYFGWPLVEHRRCRGRGQYTRKTWLTGRRVARNCTCAGGWRRRLGTGSGRKR